MWQIIDKECWGKDQEWHLLYTSYTKREADINIYRPEMENVTKTYNNKIK